MKPWSKTNQSPIGYKSKSLLGKKFITFSVTHKMADFTQCLPIRDRGTIRLIFDPCPGGLQSSRTVPTLLCVVFHTYVLEYSQDQPDVKDVLIEEAN